MRSYLFEWHDSKENVTKRRTYSFYEEDEVWCRAYSFINYEDRTTLKLMNPVEPSEYPVLCNFWEAHERYEEFRNFMDGEGKYIKRIIVPVWYKEDIEAPLRKEIQELKMKLESSMGITKEELYEHS